MCTEVTDIRNRTCKKYHVLLWHNRFRFWIGKNRGTVWFSSKKKEKQTKKAKTPLTPPPPPPHKTPVYILILSVAIFSICLATFWLKFDVFIACILSGIQFEDVYTLFYFNTYIILFSPFHCSILVTNRLANWLLYQWYHV